MGFCIVLFINVFLAFIGMVLIYLGIFPMWFKLVVLICEVVVVFWNGMLFGEIKTRNERE